MRKKHLTKRELEELSFDAGRRIIEGLLPEQIEKFRLLLGCGENATAENLIQAAHHLWKCDSPHKKLKMLFTGNEKAAFPEWLVFQISLLK